MDFLSKRSPAQEDSPGSPWVTVPRAPGICHRQIAMVSDSPAGSSGHNPQPSLAPPTRGAGPAPWGDFPFPRHSEVTSPGSAGAPPGPAALGSPGEGMGAPPGWEGVHRAKRFRVGRRCLPTPFGGQARCPPGRAIPAGGIEEGDAGTHLAPGPRPGRRMRSGGSSGWFRRRSPGRAGGPRPPRARSPRRGLRCQQTPPSLPPAGPHAPEAPPLPCPRPPPPPETAASPERWCSLP